jgi:hypothetical protein
MKGLRVGLSDPELDTLLSFATQNSQTVKIKPFCARVTAATKEKPLPTMLPSATVPTPASIPAELETYKTFDSSQEQN